MCQYWPAGQNSAFPTSAWECWVNVSADIKPVLAQWLFAIWELPSCLEFQGLYIQVYDKLNISLRCMESIIQLFKLWSPNQNVTNLTNYQPWTSGMAIFSSLNQEGPCLCPNWQSLLVQVYFIKMTIRSSTWTSVSSSM